MKTNKNDYIDAEAIAEAVGRANMRFVPIKSDKQLDMQSLHRVRDRWVAIRTSVINQMRGLLLERGITFLKGRRHGEACLPGVLEDADNRLSGLPRKLLAQMQSELRQMQSQIDEADALIAKRASEHRPGEASHLVGQCDSRDVGVNARCKLAEPCTEPWRIGNGSEFGKGRCWQKRDISASAVGDLD